MLQPLWTPSESRIRQANMTDYIGRIEAELGRTFAGYGDLHQWSVNDIPAFWQSVWDYAAVVHSKPHDRVLHGSEMWGARWFEGAVLNFAENLLRYRDDAPAIVHWAEGFAPRRYSYRDLHDKVARCAAGLRQLGVESGDRVAGFVPNIPEAVMAMLATTSIGAIWSSCSPDFGESGVMDRFGQIQPKVLFTADGYSYNGTRFDSLERITKIAGNLPSLQQTVVIPRYDNFSLPDHADLMTWEALLDNDAAEIDFAQLPFDHPVYIMYSSGTTGVPKCIVHGAGGTLLQHYKELMLHTDIKREDTVLYFTTCGWMMWNWLVSSLAVGATVFLYEGSPAHPDIGVLWRAVQEEGISVFGTSPKYLSACEQAGIRPGDTFDLGSLKTILSTGSPLSEGNFAWVYDAVKTDVLLASISGGTDIISCFMGGNPLLPVYPGEIQCLALGMKVETFDDDGNAITDAVGELVCTAPFPSRPIYFWNDPDDKKYWEAYYDHFSGVWRHGDYIRITPRGGVVVYGRSDATLNPGGVRIGTAEVYSPIEAMPEIQDSVVVAQKWQDDVRIVLFVVLAGDRTLTPELVQKIRDTIRRQRTPRHVPALVLQVQDIPRTISGKKVEMAVSRILHGQEVKNRSALANPESLDQFRDIPELA